MVNNFGKLERLARVELRRLKLALGADSALCFMAIQNRVQTGEMAEADILRVDWEQIHRAFKSVEEMIVNLEKMVEELGPVRDRSKQW